MSRERIFKKLQLFVASPGDVGPHRESVSRVAERLNRAGGPADTAGVVLEVVRWETHVAPLMGRPQAVILEQVKADTWDIFVGILWLRFGSPSGVQSPTSTKEYASGTEEEFELAYNLWKEKQRPQILLYRCLKPPESLDTLDPDQWGRITQFFSRFSPQGPTPGLYSTFTDGGDFENKLERDLARLLSTLKAESIVAGEDREQGFSTGSLLHKFQHGAAYQLAFISVDVVDHSRLVRKHQKNPTAVQSLIHGFFAFVRGIAGRHGGDVFSWAGDGGLLVFDGDGYRERAILAGLRLLTELSVFNLDPAQNVLGESISIRLAAHEAPIVFQVPTSSISSPELNLVVHLQERFAGPGEFCLTDTLLDGVSSRLAEVFSFKGRFEGQPIFSFRADSRDNAPTKKTLATLSEESREKAILVVSILREPERLERDALEVLSTSLEQYYSMVQKFASWFSSIDERWSSEYLKIVFHVATSLVDDEFEIWEGLRGRYVQRKSASGDDDEVEALVQSCSSRRSRPVLFLERLRTEIDHRLSGDIKRRESFEIATERVRSRVRDLIAADDLDKEIILTDLLINYKEPLADFVVAGDDREELDQLRRHLWASADLVLQDEIVASHGNRRKFDRKLSQILSNDPVNGVCFKALTILLSHPRVLSNEEVEKVFKASAYFLGKSEIDVVWRCLALGHSDSDTQRYAASQLSLSSAWQMISRNRLPVNLIYFIGCRFKHSEAIELQKIFCDCTRGSILEQIQRAEDRASIADLTKVILLFFEFDFMVETAYFERFDDLLTHFLQCVKRVGLKVEYFEKIRHQLESVRKERGAPSGAVPKNIRNLPLPIQRRLAGESPYLLWFVGHPDGRVALETLRHINLSNVERILKIPEVNGELMREVLTRSEFFGKWSNVLAALAHPKCTVEFGKRHLPRLRSTGQGARALAAIAHNTSANTAIRSLAKSMVIPGT